jgi:hypothetical protein
MTDFGENHLWLVLVSHINYNNMKKTFVFVAIVLLMACREENSTPIEPVIDPFDPTTPTVNLLKQGDLIGVGHTVSGSVKVYEDGGKKIVVLDPFSSQNGPDLRIYLSTDQNATQYVNLGALKSVTGKQSYDVTGMPDLEKYKFILVWCQEFSVLFGKAELK